MFEKKNKISKKILLILFIGLISCAGKKIENIEVRKNRNYLTPITNWDVEEIPIKIEDIINENKEEEEMLEKIKKAVAPPDYKKELEKELQEKEVWILRGFGKFDIPVELNREVQYFIDFFLNYEPFREWIKRSGKYIPIMREILKSEGMPEDLVYLAMIESGFSPRAYSRAHAVGIWQFIKSTAQRYNLKIDYWIDERRDPIKSTYAAIAYLKDLYNMFGDWYLALAAYNAGEAKIQRAIERSGIKDYWELARRGFIPKETSQYVPKLIAAALIMKNLEKFGLNVEMYETMEFDEIELDGQVSVWQIADASQSSIWEIIDLNPQLLRVLTPPYPIVIRVPKGKGEITVQNLKKSQIKVVIKHKSNRFYSLVPREKHIKKEIGFIEYLVDDEDTPDKISKVFGIEVKNLEPGQKLKIPIYVWEKPEIKRKKITRDGKKLKYFVYRVQRGDTITKIARKFKVNPVDIILINNIRYVRPGMRILIPKNIKSTKETKIKNVKRERGKNIKKVDNPKIKKLVAD